MRWRLSVLFFSLTAMGLCVGDASSFGRRGHLHYYPCPCPVYFPCPDSFCPFPEIPGITPQTPDPSPPKPPAQTPERIHCFCGFDTNDPILKLQLQKDSKDLEEWTNKLIPANRLAGGDAVKAVTGDKFTKQNLMDFCSNVPSDSDGVVFVYLGCHGKMDAKGKHTLKIGKDELDRNEVLAALQKKPHKLIVFLTDACAVRPIGVKAEPVPTAELPDWKICVCKSLFLDARGVVDINSASPGELAFGDNKKGGVFTQTFMDVAGREIKSLDKNGDGKISWKSEFFPALVKECNGKYSNLRTARMADKDNFDPITFDSDRDLEKQKEQKPYSYSALPDITSPSSHNTPSHAQPSGVAQTNSAPATIVVSVPADARIRFDDTLTTSVSSRRVFVTGPLPVGQSFTYTLTAEIFQEGILRSVKRSVEVSGGQKTEVDIQFPSALVGSR